MIKITISIVKFIVFFSFSYILLLVLWGEIMPHKELKKNLNYKIGSYGHLYSRIQEIKHRQYADILFIGSSHCYRGFDVRIFRENGLSSFNLGSSRQTPMQTKVLLKRHLDEISPKLVIYEVSSGAFSGDGVESSLDIIANDRNDLHSITMALSQNHIKVYNALIYGLYSDIFGRNRGYAENIKKGDDRYIAGGFVEKELKFFDYEKHTPSKIVVEDKQLQSFRMVIDFFKEREIPYILVQAPITRSRYLSYSNNKMFDTLMRSFGVYYNFNEIICLDDCLCFYDSHHLNQYGVKLFNEKLIEILFGMKKDSVVPLRVARAGDVII